MKNVALAELFEIYKLNASAGVRRDLAIRLGVSESSVEALGVGLLPGSIKNREPHAEMAWVFPERNATGDVAGLMRRYQNGKKFCVEGSKHGLYYAFNYESVVDKKRYSAGKHNWMRVDDSLYPNKDTGCPVCGRRKYCMVSANDPGNPAAVVCTQTRKGSRKTFEYGHLHILDESRNLCGSSEPVMSFINADGPVLIVEGASDTLAGLTIGIDTIGKFSNVGGLDMLKQMPITGKEVWILGENDVKPNGDWPGKDGVERTHLALRGMCRTVRVMPPDGVKDLRSWLERGLDLEQLTDYVGKHGERGNDLGPEVFEDDIAASVAKKFVDTFYKDGDTVTLRAYHGDWCRWNGKCYEIVPVEILRGQLYGFLEGKCFVQTDGKGNEKVVPYKVTRNKINDILDAFNRWCPIRSDPPVWTLDTELPDPVDLIGFNNGLLDVNAYMDGKVVLHNPDPRLFSLTCCPYDFDEDALPEFTERYLLDTYDGDQASVDLVWEWTGYCMVPDLSQEKFMLLYGEPRSGKSTILDLVTYTVGESVCGSSDLPAIGSRFGLEPLIGKLFCTFGDIRNPDQATLNRALAVILRITGGDKVYVDKKTVRGLPAIRMPLRFGLAMNELPSFTDHTRALEGRLLTLYHATSHVMDEDPSIKERVLAEAMGGKMVNLALQGLRRLRTSGKFSEPESRSMVVKQFRVLAEPVSTFIEECCKVGKGESCDKNTLYAAWQGWCRANMRKPGMPPQFSKWLLGHAPTLSVGRRNDDGRRVRTYEGINLNEWASSTFLE